MYTCRIFLSTQKYTSGIFICISLVFIVIYMNVKSIVSTNLRALREQRNLTQAEAAESMGIPFPTYRSWEYGRSIPNADTMPIVCEFYRIEPHELFYSGELPKKEITPQEALEALSRHFDNFTTAGQKNPTQSNIPDEDEIFMEAMFDLALRSEDKQFADQDDLDRFYKNIATIESEKNLRRSYMLSMIFKAKNWGIWGDPDWIRKYKNTTDSEKRRA